MRGLPPLDVWDSSVNCSSAAAFTASTAIGDESTDSCLLTPSERQGSEVNGMGAFRRGWKAMLTWANWVAECCEFIEQRPFGFEKTAGCAGWEALEMGNRNGNGNGEMMEKDQGIDF
jgi:hypothetical protein